VSEAAYLSLGSNVGERENALRLALAKLLQVADVRAISSLYETEPVEFEKQPWFLNCAIAVETDLTPEKLLAKVLEIERNMGRERTIDKGPRVIDIDIVLFGNQVISTKELTIPHPAMHHRRFVLEPLAEIAPEAWHPLLQKSVNNLLKELPNGDAVVRRVESKEWIRTSRAEERGSD
jgi:2-amino-4-hydroxy-6-hydroxymethyldihydropteridine diphosphokinase